MPSELTLVWDSDQRVQAGLSPKVSERTKEVNKKGGRKLKVVSVKYSLGLWNQTGV